MSIESVTAIPLRLPYDIGGPKPEFAGRLRTHMDMLLVRAETSDGIVGWGEAFAPFVGPATRSALETLVIPLVVGKSEDNFQPLMTDIRRKLHLFGRGGPVAYAISGIDIALWDIAGKKAGCAVSELLGGAKRKSLRGYASLIRQANDEALSLNCRRAVSAGYKAVKIHAHTTEQAAFARQTMGDNIDLMMDVNCNWSLEEALGYLPRLQELKLRWLEEPVWPPEKLENLQQLRSSSPVPIAAGENADSEFDIVRMAKSKAVDLVQPSVTKIGGISELMSIVRAVTKGDAEIILHSAYFGPGLLATFQVASLLSTDTMIKSYFCDLPVNPLGEVIRFKGGEIAVPTGVGLGGDPDPDIVREYRV